MVYKYYYYAFLASFLKAVFLVCFMGELENYLEEHSAPDKSAVIGENLERLEALFSTRLSALGFREPIYKNVLVRDESGKELSLLSFVSTVPELKVLRLLEGEKHIGRRKGAIINACQHLAYKFNRTAKLRAITYTPTEEGYKLIGRNWVVTYRYAFEVDPKGYERTYLKLKDNMLVVGIGARKRGNGARS